MVDIESKRGHKVSVLLTPDIKGAMDILVKKRQEAKHQYKQQVFLCPPSEDSLNHIRHWDCLRKQCTGLKLKQPDLITSTHLRKYVATVSQVLDLQEKELDWLVRHMGHDIRVHREYYRLHESTLELAKVSKILALVDCLRKQCTGLKLALMDEGNISQAIGKSLNDIDVLGGKKEQI